MLRWSKEFSNEDISIFSLPLFVLLTGCATITNTLSDNTKEENDFRETQWGFSQQRVLVAEKDSRLYLKRDDVLIFNSEIAGVPAYLVYTFKDNKLRAAGYITEKPVKNAQNITKMSVDKLGKPTKRTKEGMFWDTPETVIFANAYPSHITLGAVRYEHIPGGVFANLLHNIKKNQKGSIDRWDAVWSYIDKSYYDEQRQDGIHLSELSFYEKVLLGAIKRHEFLHYKTKTGYQLPIPHDFLNHEIAEAR